MSSKRIPEKYQSLVNATTNAIGQSSYDLLYDRDNASIKRFGSDFINNYAEELATSKIKNNIRYDGNNPVEKFIMDKGVSPITAKLAYNKAMEEFKKNYGELTQYNQAYFDKLYMEELERLGQLR